MKNDWSIFERLVVAWALALVAIAILGIVPGYDAIAQWLLQLGQVL